MERIGEARFVLLGVRVLGGNQQLLLLDGGFAFEDRGAAPAVEVRFHGAVAVKIKGGAVLGAASYTDFLIFARTIQDLEGGVFLNVGSAVTGRPSAEA